MRYILVRNSCAALTERERVRIRTKDWRRVATASICLLAALLLYAPYGAAAWNARTAACCADGKCAIPEHRHGREASGGMDGHEECEHGLALTPCKMACCHNVERAAVTAGFFVLAPGMAKEDLGSARSEVLAHGILFESEFAVPAGPPPRSNS